MQPSSQLCASGHGRGMADAPLSLSFPQLISCALFHQCAYQVDDDQSFKNGVYELNQTNHMQMQPARRIHQQTAIAQQKYAEKAD